MNDEHFVFVALRSQAAALQLERATRMALSVASEAAVPGGPGGPSAPRPGGSGLSSGPRRTGITLFTCRPDRAAFPLGAGRVLSTGCHANRNGDCNSNYFLLTYALRPLPLRRSPPGVSGTTSCKRYTVRTNWSSPNSRASLEKNEDKVKEGEF